MAYVTNRLQKDERWQRLLLGDWHVLCTGYRVDKIGVNWCIIQGLVSNSWPLKSQKFQCSKCSNLTHLEHIMACLTHWGRVTHICASEPTSIGSDNVLSPGRRKVIIWTNAGMLLILPLGTNFSEILTFSLQKMHLKVLSAKRWPFCLGLNVLTHWPLGDLNVILDK